MAASPRLQLQAPYPQLPAQQQQPQQQQQQQLLQGPPGSSSSSNPARPRKCAEVCMDLLFTEAVQFFSEQHYGPAAGAALQAVGVRVGRQLAERYSRDKPRLGDTLEVVKFICKDFWLAVFKKQVDNLKTNHRGIYMLQDNNFRWLLRVAPAAAPTDGSSPSEQLAAAAAPYLELPCGIIRAAPTDGSSPSEQLAAAAAPYLELPCGIIRGALTHLGLNCTVEGDARSLPSSAPTDGSSPSEQLAAAAAPYLELPCGIIRGALTHLGLNCTVEGDARSLPSCALTHLGLNCTVEGDARSLPSCSFTIKIVS
uniref:Trafficking protein particle complex subunit 6B n=1 Tax=Tetradesmus obliquus TaxID=3088 RepID=A0A383WPL0_TETOB|eukprot:jgi/Sobl393_1/13285/SZX79203.1